MKRKSVTGADIWRSAQSSFSCPPRPPPATCVWQIKNPISSAIMFSISSNCHPTNGLQLQQQLSVVHRTILAWQILHFVFALSKIHKALICEITILLKDHLSIKCHLPFYIYDQFSHKLYFSQIRSYCIWLNRKFIVK